MGFKLPPVSLSPEAWLKDLGPRSMRRAVDVLTDAEPAVQHMVRLLSAMLRDPNLFGGAFVRVSFFFSFLPSLLFGVGLIYLLVRSRRRFPALSKSVLLARAHPQPSQRLHPLPPPPRRRLISAPALPPLRR